jgi:dihydrofolate synthase / folylpolyglutamate synthase
VVAARAAECDSPLAQIGRDFDFHYRPPRNLDAAACPARMDFRHQAGDATYELTDVALELIGGHQAANAAVGIATLVELRRQGWNIPDAAIRQGLAEVRWPARVEVIARRPTIVLDAAHNVASAEALARVLKESFAAGKRLLVFATTREKDALGMLEVLLPHFDEAIFTRYWNNPRGLPAEELETLATGCWGGKVHVRSDAQAAWQLARELAGPDDLICITGSFFIAAEMRAAIRGLPVV